MESVDSYALLTFMKGTKLMLKFYYGDEEVTINYTPKQGLYIKIKDQIIPFTDAFEKTLVDHFGYLQLDLFRSFYAKK